MTFHSLSLSLSILLTLISSTSYYSALAADFCVADLTTQTASGFTCKNPSNVTVSDFVFTGLINPGNTTNINKAAAVPGFVQQFPALNGLGIAVARADIEPGGSIPLHTHPAATEMLYMVEGTIVTGFISGASNVAYVTKLTKGEVMVYPRGLFHFQVNSGTEHAMGIASFSDSEPGVQLVPMALFGNDFGSFLVEKTTNIDEAEVKKLKALLGGSG
ncbi:Germin-like protein subfamily 3 member 3 [Linum grandiflorum]